MQPFQLFICKTPDGKRYHAIGVIGGKQYPLGVPGDSEQGVAHKLAQVLGSAAPLAHLLRQAIQQRFEVRLP